MAKIHTPCALQASLQISGRRMRTDAFATGANARQNLATPAKTRGIRRMPLVLCLQVNLDAEFVLANLDAARRNTSPLVKQGLASDRDLPGLQNHACKRAYVSFFSINPLSRNRSIALYVLTFDTFNLFATSVYFTISICSASSFAAIKYLNSDELILLSSSASRLA